MKKRSLKSIATILSLVMTFSAFAPTLALARGHHRPPPHHHRPHHSGRAWAVALGILGIGALIAHNNSRSSSSEQVVVYESDYVYDYDSYKQNFVNNLDSHEFDIFSQINGLRPNKSGYVYRYIYGRDVTKRRLIKIIKALHEDFEYKGLDSTYVYFVKKQ